jgi:hypothetical protein
MLNCLYICFKENKKEENNIKNEENNKKEENNIKGKNTFRNLVNNVISLGSFRNNKEKNNICKICHKPFNNDKNICHCLKNNDLHPNNKETTNKIREKYVNNNQIINEAIHIDNNPDKLVLLINDIYDIVEKSSLNDDLTPKTLEKVKENLVNQICINIENYIKDDDL